MQINKIRSDMNEQVEQDDKHSDYDIISIGEYIDTVR